MKTESRGEENQDQLQHSERRRLFSFQYLGLLSYAEGLRAQEHALSELEKDSSCYGKVLGLEHKPVITLGKRARKADDLAADILQIEAQGFEIFESPRGGHATLHSPGQLVVYPCVHLQRIGIGVRDYVCVLEKSIRNTLQGLGIETLESCGEPGVYTRRGKIAFFGVRVSKGMASHGLSLNFTNDLGFFELIRSCGKDSESFDRVSDQIENSHGKQTLTEMFKLWEKHFLDLIA